MSFLDQIVRLWPRARRIAKLQAELAQKDEQLREAISRYQELRHRVKNDLQALINLLSAQARIANQPDHCRRCILRLSSAAHLHNVLDSETDEVLMGDYLAGLSTELKKAFDEHVRFETVVEPDIFLDRRRAQCIGLIYAEAAMNALKHAFPEGSAGELGVHLQRKDGSLEMTVSDNGVGIDQASSHAGRGIALMKELAVQLRGTLKVERLPVGTMVDLVLPVA